LAGVEEAAVVGGRVAERGRGAGGGGGGWLDAGRRCGPLWEVGLALLHQRLARVLRGGSERGGGRRRVNTCQAHAHDINRAQV